MQRSLNNDNFYIDKVEPKDVTDDAFRLHTPVIYNANCLMLCRDLRFCMKSSSKEEVKEGYNYYSTIIEEIFPNKSEMPDKPYAKKTSLIAIKKEYFNGQ